MKSRPVFIVLFLVIGFVLYWLFDAFVTTGVRNSRMRQLGKVNKICSHDSFPQVAIFGSSVGEVGINAPSLNRATGLTAYNYSIDGTRFTQYAGLVNELRDASKRTKLVILTESYFSFAKTDALTEPERYLANISNDNVYKALYGIQPDLIWKCRYVPGYKYTVFSHLYYMAAADGWKRYFRGAPADTLLGYTPVYRNWEADQDEILNNLKPFTIEIDSTYLRAYKESVTRLKEKGIMVALILPPVYMAALASKTDFTPLRKALTDVAHESNCIFWDFSTHQIGTDKSLFYNSNHLNNKGADAFTSILADSVCRYISCTMPH